ncbi:MAG: hypothetical protein RLY21_2660 [Planctomycetota bacterium]|jgi:DNA-binding CsgD family transcriptional regulator
MKPFVLNLACPKLRAVMSDISLTQRWEVLRRSSSPLTTHELAVGCGVSDSVAQRSIDLLVEAGLAVRLKAVARRREITYRAVAERVIVQWDTSSAGDVAFLMQHRQALRVYSRSIIDQNDTVETGGMPGFPKFRGHQSYSLTRAEAEAIAQALRRAWEFITQIEMQARERSALAKAEHGQRGNAAVSTEDPQEHPYHIALEFRPLKTPELPIADIGTWEKRALARELAYLTMAPAAVLTQREQQIAKRLANGDSRPNVAEALGVSVNTVNSATKRIYAKLGIHTRAELTARLKGV